MKRKTFLRLLRLDKRKNLKSFSQIARAANILSAILYSGNDSITVYPCAIFIAQKCAAKWGVEDNVMVIDGDSISETSQHSIRHGTSMMKDTKRHEQCRIERMYTCLCLTVNEPCAIIQLKHYHMNQSSNHLCDYYRGYCRLLPYFYLLLLHLICLNAI